MLQWFSQQQRQKQSGDILTFNLFYTVLYFLTVIWTFLATLFLFTRVQKKNKKNNIRQLSNHADESRLMALLTLY